MTKLIKFIFCPFELPKWRKDKGTVTKGMFAQVRQKCLD